VGPLFQSHDEPVDPDRTYFNYNTGANSKYGPRNWKNVTVLNSTENYWYEFGFVENMCDVGTAQSPIDLCAEPTRQCMEEHEYRSRSGDYTIEGNLTDKQILPNKLRVVMARRQGEEPDPPATDFSGVGYQHMDMLNLDIRFPSEHTLCGRNYDGEMQYFFWHPVRRALIGIAWLIEAQEVNATNNHMQLLIDEFQHIYDSNVEACVYNDTASYGNASQQEYEYARPAKIPQQLLDSKLFKRSLNGHRDLKKPKPWDPFHVDIQKTIHFWGYSGSLTGECRGMGSNESIHFRCNYCRLTSIMRTLSDRAAMHGCSTLESDGRACYHIL
jgi:carbonic anhydrase